MQQIKSQQKSTNQSKPISWSMAIWHIKKEKEIWVNLSKIIELPEHHFNYVVSPFSISITKNQQIEENDCILLIYLILIHQINSIPELTLMYGYQKRFLFKTFSLTKFMLVLIHSFMDTRILYLLNCQICKGFTECFAFMIFSIFEAQWEAILQNRKWFIRNIAHQDKLKTINMFLFKTLKNKKQYSCDKITTTWIQNSRQNWNGYFSNASHRIIT